MVAAIKETSPVETLRVDGGLTNEPLLLQLQADMIGAPVEAAGADATVLGAAALGGVGAGVIASLDGPAGDAARRIAGWSPSGTRNGARPSTSAGASSSQATEALDPR